MSITMRMSVLVLPWRVSGGQSTTSKPARVKSERWRWKRSGFR